MTRRVIAIDGPAGAGKSAAARGLAKRLGYTYLDTGALYRSLALMASRRGVSHDNAPGLAQLCSGLVFAFAPSDTDAPAVLVNGEDVTAAIRTPEVTEGSSRVSRHPEVRKVLVGIQRRMAGQGRVVMEGRDIGSVVLPDADLKVFLTASAEARADRRHKELLAKGAEITLAEVLASQAERDRRDQERETSPLRPASDAVILDTSAMTLEQVIQRLVDLAEGRA